MGVTISGLLSQNINFNLGKIISCNQLGSDKLQIKYRLSIPSWIDDKTLVTQENHSILYSGNKKKNIKRHEVFLWNLDSNYPEIGNNKYFCYKKEYNIMDWVKPGFNILYFLKQEREAIFKELKANIVLEKIGHLSKQWQNLTDGKFQHSDQILVNYGKSKQLVELSPF